MTLSRFVLIAGLIGAAYAPTASAKFVKDVTLPQPVDTQTSTTDSGTTVSTPVTAEDTTPMTRASFTSLVVEHLYSEEQIASCYWDIAPSLPPTFRLLYTDVHASSPYGKKLCIALRDGLARGYKDGSFHPDQPITFSEASKILARAYGLAPYAEATNQGPWFSAYAMALASHNAIPTSVSMFDHVMTAGETVDMLNRLSNKITTEPSQSYEILLHVTKPAAMKAPMIPATPVMILPTEQTTPMPVPSSSSSSAASEEMSSERSSALPWYKLF